MDNQNLNSLENLDLEKFTDDLRRIPKLFFQHLKGPIVAVTTNQNLDLTTIVAYSALTASFGAMVGGLLERSVISAILAAAVGFLTGPLAVAFEAFVYWYLLGASKEDKKTEFIDVFELCAVSTAMTFPLVLPLSYYNVVGGQLALIVTILSLGGHAIRSFLIYQGLIKRFSFKSKLAFWSVVIPTALVLLNSLEHLSFYL